MTRTLRSALVIVAAALLVTPEVAITSQTSRSVWRTRSTAHFDIYYTQQTGLDEIAREAEQAYSRVVASAFRRTTRVRLKPDTT